MNVTTQRTDARRLRNRICAECAARTVTPDRSHCSTCMRDYVAALRRRRSADLRLPRVQVMDR